MHCWQRVREAPSGARLCTCHWPPATAARPRADRRRSSAAAARRPARPSRARSLLRRPPASGWPRRAQASRVSPAPVPAAQAAASRPRSWRARPAAGAGATAAAARRPPHPGRRIIRRRHGQRNAWVMQLRSPHGATCAAHIDHRQEHSGPVMQAGGAHGGCRAAPPA